MNYKPIIIVAGEPNSIFLEIFFKSLNKLKIKNPIILIASLKLVKLQMIELKYKIKIKILDRNNIAKHQLNNNCINLIDVEYNPNKAFEKISMKSNVYIHNCFNVAIKLLKNNISDKLINGPIFKKNFFKK
jgi:4-hydroxythreonine-4-phosphate dehydrogenase